MGGRIEEFEGRPVRTITDFNALRARTRPGRKVAFTIRRGPRLLTIRGRLGGD